VAKCVITHDVYYYWIHIDWGTRPLDDTHHQPLLGVGYCIYQVTNSMCSQTGETVKGWRALARCPGMNTFRQNGRVGTLVL